MRNAELKGDRPRPRDLKSRTKAFALDVVRLVNGFPRLPLAAVIGNQLVRCGTSVAANYRSACRARSRREFIAKMGIVEEEADEAELWLELSADQALADAQKTARLAREAHELVAIVIASIRTARKAPRAIPHSAFRIPHSPAAQCS